MYSQQLRVTLVLWVVCLLWICGCQGVQSAESETQDIDFSAEQILKSDSAQQQQLELGEEFLEDDTANNDTFNAFCKSLAKCSSFDKDLACLKCFDPCQGEECLKIKARCQECIKEIDFSEYQTSEELTDFFDPFFFTESVDTFNNSQSEDNGKEIIEDDSIDTSNQAELIANQEKFTASDLQQEQDKEQSTEDKENEKSEQSLEQQENWIDQLIVATSQHAFYSFQVLEAFLHNQVLPSFPQSLPNVQTALFVTWLKNKKLRGCIGTFASRKIAQSLSRFVLISSQEDDRFGSIRADQFPHLEVGVSLLQNFQVRKSLTNWQVGRHGVILDIDLGDGQQYSATYLPQVITLNKWSKQETLRQLVDKSECPFTLEQVQEYSTITTYETSKITMSYGQYIKVKEARNQAQNMASLQL